MGSSKAKSHQKSANKLTGGQGDATDLAQEAQARKRSAAINEAHEKERRDMHKQPKDPPLRRVSSRLSSIPQLSLQHPSHELRSFESPYNPPRLNPTPHPGACAKRPSSVALFRVGNSSDGCFRIRNSPSMQPASMTAPAPPESHRADACRAAAGAGEPFQPPALFQVANLPESMTDPAGRRTEGWVESSLQKIERQLTGMVLDAGVTLHQCASLRGAGATAVITAVTCRERCMVLCPVSDIPPTHPTPHVSSSTGDVAVVATFPPKEQRRTHPGKQAIHPPTHATTCPIH
ncbi:MAG: hypothetical protein WDW38_010100 [Sanguina aurantia]